MEPIPDEEFDPEKELREEALKEAKKNKDFKEVERLEKLNERWKKSWEKKRKSQEDMEMENVGATSTSIDYLRQKI